MLLKGNSQNMKEFIETKKVIAEVTRSVKDQKKIKEITQKVEQGPKRWTYEKKYEKKEVK